MAFTGLNGGGKSTLAKVIVILTPTEGRILWEEDITPSVTERAKKGISYAFQQPVRFKGLTVRDLISIAAGKRQRFPTPAFIFQRSGCARGLYRPRSECFAVGGELKRIEIATILARGTKPPYSRT
ncbi:MAG: ATP-binding cassette domain-containing protein [Christensenellaceae bacterium]